MRAAGVTRQTQRGGGKAVGYSVVQMIRAIFRTDNGLNEHEKIVMTCLAQHADEQGMCFPSISTIAKECSISRSTALRAIEGLTKKGWITPNKRNGCVTTYTCRIPATGIAQEPVSHRHRTGVPQTPEDTQEVNKYAAAAVYKEHQQQENIVTAFERCFGRFPSSYQLEVFESYIQDGLDERLVILAMEKAAMDGKGPRYAQGILQDWLTKGIRTVEQAEREEREWRERQKVVPMRRTSPAQPEKPKTITLTPEEIARIEAEHQRKIDEWLKDADGETFYRQWLKMKQRRAMNQNAGAAAQ